MGYHVVPVRELWRRLLRCLRRKDAALCLAQNSTLGSLHNLQSAGSLFLRRLLVYPLRLFAFQSIIMFQPLTERSVLCSRRGMLGMSVRRVGLAEP
jgi:hypothetical protein